MRPITRFLPLAAILICLSLLPLAGAVAAPDFGANDNNVQWAELYHSAVGFDPQTELVPWNSYQFRQVDASGRVLPTTNVVLSILVDNADITSANIVYSTGGADAWVPMIYDHDLIANFHGTGNNPYSVWRGTIPAQAAGTTVWYRFQVNDGGSTAWLKNGAGDWQNPLGQYVNGSDFFGANYTYTVAGDNDIHWTEVLHDTFDSDYRDPGGAVAAGSTASIRLRLRAAQDDLTSARVRTWDDRTNTETYYDMAWDAVFDTDPVVYDYWVADIPLPAQPTILYYFFELNDGTDQDFYTDFAPLYYGGGFGIVQDNFDAMNSFQVTVYDPAFDVPEWIQKAVVYQVFPDRFRDGDAGNNPAAGRFFYNSPGGTIVRSNDAAGDWNTSICDPRDAGGDCPGAWSQNFYGGDLAGITEKIEAGYFDQLGVTVLYLNPIFASPSNHKYDTANYLEIDPDFGTLADFQALAAAAEAHGMRLILDGVFNHTSSDSPYFDLYSRYDSAGNLTSPGGVGVDDDSGACEAGPFGYYSWYFFPAFSSPSPDLCANGTLNALQTYEAWFGYSSLPKLDSTREWVRDLIWDDGLASVGPYWVDHGASGWRFDVGGDVDPGLTNDPGNDYWEGFRAAVKTVDPDSVTLGEEWGDASPWLLGNEWDSAMNYRFRSAVLSWLFTNCTGPGCTGGITWEDNDDNLGSSSGVVTYLPPSAFNARLLSIQEDYPPEAWKAMLNLADSHDTNRLRFVLKQINGGNDAAALQRMRELWIFAFTYAGAPTIYYGDEVGLSQDGVVGTTLYEDDPYNRVPFPWDDTPGDLSADTSLQDFLRKMASIRHSYGALQDGDVVHGIVLDDVRQLYGYARVNGSQTALVVLNRGLVPQPVTLSGLNNAPYNLPDGTVLVDALSGTPAVVAGGAVSVTVNPAWGAVLLEAAKIDTPAAPANLMGNVPPGGDPEVSWDIVSRDLGGGVEVATQYTVHVSTVPVFVPGPANLFATVTPPAYGTPGGRISIDTDVHEGDYYIVCAYNAGRMFSCTSVMTLNYGPTAMALSNNTIAENLPVGTLVGTLSTTDPDLLDVHTYSLVSGVPGCDGAGNGSFQVPAGTNRLENAAVFDFETPPTSFNVCIRTTDPGGLTYERSFTITVTNADETAPVLNSFARQTPSNRRTNADTLIFRATFSEAVQNVGGGDFAVTGTTATVTLVTPVSATIYDLTVSGGDLASFNGQVELNLAVGQDISDLAGNPLPSTEPATDQNYLLDNNAPVLNAFRRQDPATTPTNADTLLFRATFNEDVQNVDATDFTVNGATTATVTGVAQVSASTYDITVSGGDLASFNGTVGVNLAAGQNITDLAGNSLPAGEPSPDQTYTVDNTGPVLNSFRRQTPATTPTNADTLIFRAVFNEDVQGVDAADFAVNGGTTATVTGVAQVSASTYDITVSGGDLASYNGTVGLDLAAGKTISDLPGNVMTAGEPATDQTYTLDNTAPVLNSFARRTPAGSPTNADTLLLRATFSENVQNVEASDFAVNGTTTATVTGVTQINARTYDITISGGNLASFNGTVGLDLAAGQNITDLVGNVLPAGEPATDETYLVDNTAPVLNSFTRQTPATSPTNADTLVFRATFNEDVQNVNAADFAVSGTTAGLSVASVDARTYDITLSGGNLAGLNGTVGINLSAGQNIADLAGNALPAGEPGTDETYLVDNIAPGLVLFIRFAPSSSPTNGSMLTFNALFDEDVTSVGTADFAVNGTTTATVTGVSMVDARTYDITISGGDLASFNGTVGLNLAGGQDITDLAGNALPAGEPGTDETYVVDHTAPALTSFRRQTPATSPTNADILVFQATFSEDVTSVGTADFAVNGTTTATVTGVSAVDARTYDITVSGGNLATFNGTVGVNLAAGQNITDLAGNALPAGEPGTDETYLVDNTAPVLSSFLRQTPATSPTNADTLIFRATFSEDVQNIGTADFAVNGTTTATVTGISAVDARTYDITISGGDLAGFNGTVGINLSVGQNITDLAGNALPAGEPGTDETYLVDNTVPVFTSITRLTPATSPTNLDTLIFRATFSEDVQNLGTADFAVNGTTTATVTGISAVDARTYDITISGGDLASFNGTVGVDLAGGQDITDPAGNALPAGEPATDETYLVDNTPPDTVIDTGPVDPTNDTTPTFTFHASEAGSTFECSMDSTTAYAACTSGVTFGALAQGAHTFRVRATDPAGNLDATPATHTWTIDTGAPALQSFARQNPAASPTNADVLIFRATFNEDVQNVGVADFAVNGTTTAAITNVAVVDAHTYDITISGGDLASFNGTVGVDLAGGQDIRDLAGNALPAGEPATDQTYVLDNIGLAVTLTSTVTSPTNISPIPVTVTFSEPVTDFTLADLGVTNGTAGNLQGSGTTYTVEITPAADGLVTVDLPAGAAHDGAGNGNTAAQFTIYSDTTPPVVHSITDPSLNPTNAGQVWYRVSFSEAVVGVGVNDFSIHAEGITGARVVEVTGEGRHYTVVVSTGHGGGTLRLDMPETATVTDLAGNPLVELPYTEGAVYEVRFTTFADVPVSHWAWRFVERLYDARLTTGCGSDPLVYCPEENVTRAQMAAFLERGLHYPAAFVPPAGTGLVFGDVPPGYWALDWIEALFADGLTTGCAASPLVYCPEEAVSRAQMAVFLLRARHGAGYVPPAAVGIFSDVPLVHWAAAWIEQLFAEGITTGCSTGPLSYCPEEPVTRAQMAVFLVRAFLLP